MSFLSGLFGGVKPQTIEASPYRNQQAASLKQLGSLGASYGQIADQGAAQVSAYAGQARQAAQANIDGLSENPFTSQRKIERVAANTAGAASRYAGVKSRLSASMQQRGLSGDLQNAYSLANEDAFANTLTSADDQERAYEENAQTAQRADRANYTQSLVNQGQAQRAQGVSGQAGIYSQQMNGANEIAGAYEGLADRNATAVQRAQQDNQQMWGSFIGGAAQFATGQYFGAGGKGAGLFKKG